MKVLLVNTNREKLPQPVIPLGLCCVASALEQKGHQVKVVDLCFDGNPFQTLAESIATFSPDCLGLSIRNLDNSQYRSFRHYLPEVKRLISAIKRYTGVPIVIGGAAVGVAPWALLDYLDCQYAIAGDGEEAMGRFVEVLGNGAISNLVGATIRSDGKAVVRVNADYGVNYNSFSRPWRWLDLSPYFAYHVPLPVQSKRGCVFECSYCTYCNVEGSGYRLRAVDHIAAEIAESVEATGHRLLEFVDSVFGYPEDHAIEVCRAISSGRHRPMLQASINPKGSSDELLREMRRAGFNNLVCTPDSASDTMLSNLGKGFTVADLSRTVDNVHKNDIPVLWCFLFGGPGETESTVRETLNFIERRLTGKDVVCLSACIRVYPGTRLAEMVVKEGMISPEDSLLSPAFYFSPALSSERFFALVGDHLSRHRNYMVADDLGLGWLLKVQRMAAVLGWKTPLWQHASLFNLFMPKRWKAGARLKFEEGVTKGEWRVDSTA